MLKLTPFVLALGLGLFIGKFHADFIEPAAILGSKLNSPMRSPASVAPAVATPIPTAANIEAPLSETAVVKYFKEIGINRASEIFHQTQKEFIKQNIATYFHEVQTFNNVKQHQKWIQALGQRMYNKSQQWRGVGTILLGGQSADLEFLLTPAHEERFAESSTTYPCFMVEAYIRLNGGLTPLTNTLLCAESLLYKDGDYYMSYSTYQQFGAATDLSMLTVALPQSKSETVKYLIDGDPDWQNAAFTWTPVSEIDRQARISELSHEMFKGAQ